MEKPAVTTDQIYEESLRKAEQTFHSAFVNWKEMLSNEAKQWGPPKQYYEGLVLVQESGDPPKFISEGAMGLMRKNHPINRLRNLCENYIKDELRAYAEHLQRRGIPTMHALEDLEKHAEATLKATYRRKWSHGVTLVSRHCSIEKWMETPSLNDVVHKRRSGKLRPSVPKVNV